MASIISWIEPTNSSVGSVLIYRATNTKLDSLGSRTLVTTIGAKDINGSWVVSYNDSSGDNDSVYRIQFYDGVGSSSLSDSISQEYSEQLATFEDVLRLARLQRHYDLGSDVVYDAIRNASEEIYYKYGDPVKKTYFYLDTGTGVTGGVYDFTKDLGPVYQVREVFVDTQYPDIVPNTSFQVDYGQGKIKFSDSFLGSYQGKYVYVHWVPSVVNLLVKNMAALELTEGELVLNGRDTSNPQTQRLREKIGELGSYLAPKGLFAPRLFNDLEEGYDFVEQKQERKHIYFNY
jgi:hypothetical protein